MDEKALLTALGPLAEVYQDPEVQEIIVDSYDSAALIRGGEIESIEVQFDSPEAFQGMIEAIAALESLTLDEEHTTLDIRLPGRNRLIAAIPPTALLGPHLVIRKFNTSQRITWDFLLEIGAVTPELVDLFHSALEAETNILVAGGKSSGKTTFTNRLAELIPEDKHLVVVEGTHEMDIDHPRRIYLEARRVPGMTVDNLLETAQHMIPHWMVINDLHGAEALSVMQLFSSGYTGIATLHASDPQDALARLEAMCLTANSGLGLVEIRNLISTAVQLVVVANRIKLKDGSLSRKITHVSELQGLENSRYLLQPLFRFNPETEQIESTGVSPSWE